METYLKRDKKGNFEITLTLVNVEQKPKTYSLTYNTELLRLPVIVSDFSTVVFTHRQVDKLVLVLLREVVYSWKVRLF